jgi:hypothetical protein
LKQPPTGWDLVVVCPDPSDQLANPQASILAVAVHRSTADPVDPAHLNKQLRQLMVRLGPIPVARRASPGTFVHKDLSTTASMSFSARMPHPGLWSLPTAAPTWSYLEKRKTLQFLVHGKPLTVSTDRVKPTYVLNESGHGSYTFNSPASTTPSPLPTPPST